MRIQYQDIGRNNNIIHTKKSEIDSLAVPRKGDKIKLLGSEERWYVICTIFEVDSDLVIVRCVGEAQE